MNLRDTHKFGVYENWVTSGTQKNKLKLTLCALNMCVFSLFIILFRHLAFFSCFPSSWTYLSFPWELSLFCKCTHHHLSCLFISALITLFHPMLVSFFLSLCESCCMLSNSVHFPSHWPSNPFPVLPTTDRVWNNQVTVY